MVEVYKIKKELTKEQLEAAGFLTKDENGETVYICFVPQPLDGDLVKSMLNIYEDPKWKDYYYKGESKKTIQKAIGLTYDKKGKVNLNEKFIKFLTMWRVQFYSEDRMLILTSLDPFDSTGFCNKKVIDQFCGELVKELNDKNMLEVSEENI